MDTERQEQARCLPVCNEESRPRFSANDHDFGNEGFMRLMVTARWIIFPSQKAILVFITVVFLAYYFIGVYYQRSYYSSCATANRW